MDVIGLVQERIATVDGGVPSPESGSRIYPNILTNTGCKFPVTHDGEWLFCGEAFKDDNSPYCSHHHAICYTPRGTAAK